MKANEIRKDVFGSESGPLPEVIMTDALRLKQILYNVIGNSIKFTSEGHVKVVIRQDEDNLVFNVSDTGIGIKEEYRDKLFQNFAQANPEVPRDFGGTGLGLALSIGRQC